MDHLQRLIAALLLLLFGTAHAGGSWTVNALPLKGDVAGRQTLKVGSDLADILDRHPNVAVGRAAVDVVHTRRVSAVAVGRALAGAAGKIVVPLSIAQALKGAYCELGGGGPLCDPFGGTTMQSCYRVNGWLSWSGQPCASSSSAAMTAYANWSQSEQNANPYGEVWTHTVAYAPPAAGTGSINTSYCWNGSCSGVTARDVSVYKLDDSPGCEPPNVLVAPGQCTTGRMEPVSEDQFANRVKDRLAPNLPNLVDDAMKAGAEIGSQHVESQKLSGPASATEPPITSTRTTPEGTPQTRTEQVTNHITYGPTTMTWTSTTTINNYDGSSETTPEKPEEEKKTECEEHPETLGCAEFGEPGNPDLNKQDLPISYAPDGGWGADNGSCPAPSTVSVLGQPVTIDNSLFCTYLAGIRGAVIACFGFVAAMIFVGGLKQ